MVGGINSEIARLMKISVQNLKLGWGKHAADEARKILVCEKKESWQIPSPKKCTRVLDFFRSMVRLVY